MTLGATPQEVRFNKAILYSMGFTQREIAAFAEAKTPAGTLQPPINLGSDVWRRIIEERQQWLQDLQDAHVKAVNKRYKRREVDAIIDSFYDKDPDFSPWDWLKKEYQKSRYNGQPLNHIEAARQRALTKTYNMRHFVK